MTSFFKRVPIVFILFVVLVSPPEALAQDDVPALGILSLESTGLPDYKVVKINKYVESAFYKSKRFNIVSRQLQEAIRQEREQEKENLDLIIIEQGKAIGADYIVKGIANDYQQNTVTSSPLSRAPYRGRSTQAKTTKKESPRKKTEVEKDKSKTKSTALAPVQEKTGSNSTTKSKTKSSPRAAAGKTKSPDTIPAKTSVAKKPKTAPIKTSKAKKTEPEKTPAKKPVPPSSEIDKIYTSTQIKFIVKIIDVKTGVIIAEETYKGSINGVTAFVNKLVRKAFPFSFNIIEIMEKKGDKKAKHILLDGGFEHGLKQGDYLKVYEVSEELVDGKTFQRETPVGDLLVRRLDTGGNFSLCTIYKGRKTVLEKMNAGIKLICK